MKIQRTGSGCYLVLQEQGPDTRYHKRDKKIPVEQIPEWIQQIREAYELYLEKKALHMMEEIRFTNEITIRIGGLYEGVQIYGYPKRVKSEKQLEILIQELNLKYEEKDLH